MLDNSRKWYNMCGILLEIGKMNSPLINDDREHVGQVIRAKGDRRKNKTLFHLLVPFRDSSGGWVAEDRRSGIDRRNPVAI